jgi:hypothetical protein
MTAPGRAFPDGFVWGRCDHWHRWRQDLQVLAMCAGCRELGLEPVVTYYPFTTTRWVAVNGFEPPITAGIAPTG